MDFVPLIIESPFVVTLIQGAFGRLVEHTCKLSWQSTSAPQTWEREAGDAVTPRTGRADPEFTFEQFPQLHYPSLRLARCQSAVNQRVIRVIKDARRIVSCFLDVKAFSVSPFSSPPFRIAKHLASGLDQTYRQDRFHGWCIALGSYRPQPRKGRKIVAHGASRGYDGEIDTSPGGAKEINPPPSLHTHCKNGLRPVIETCPSRRGTIPHRSTDIWVAIALHLVEASRLPAPDADGKKWLPLGRYCWTGFSG